MLLFIHFIGASSGAGIYCTMREKDIAWSGNVCRLTARRFRNEESVVRYAERLLTQDNLPDVVRTLLKAFIDKHYTGTAFVLDALDNSYKPARR